MMAANTQETLSKCESDENEQLIHKTQSLQPRKWTCCYPHFSYRLVKISEKGAMFMIIFNMSFAALLLNRSNKGEYPSIDQSPAFECSLGGIAFVILPVIGFLSDSYFGRYNILKASLYLSLVTIIFMALTTIIKSAIFYYIIIVAFVLSMGCYLSCIIPFTIDQLVGASGEELSFTTYWMTWAWTTYYSIGDLFICYLPQSSQLQQALWFFVSSISFIISYIMMNCCSHVLMTKPQLSNPIKLVALVLNYARKHKFPMRRSAFTYWENECPSRIDLGKDKYGGPFTIEEVEDVKTFLRLIPLITCITLTLMMQGSVGVKLSLHICDSSDLRFWIRFLQNLVVIVYLPIYQFLIYPFLYNHIPSMLRRIGFGLFLIVLSHLFNSAVELSVIEQSHMSDMNTTLTNVTHQSENVPISGWLMVTSSLISHVGLIITTITTFEFCMAQAPCQVRGLVSSSLLATSGIFGILASVLHGTFNGDQVAYILLSVVMLGCFVLFVFVSKWYKLRKRDDIIPYHMFAEDQFESNYRQERNWLRNHGYSE